MSGLLGFGRARLGSIACLHNGVSKMNLEQVIEKTKALSASDRALLAHCLISSLETQHDEDVDAAWSALVEQRLDDLEADRVQTVSWDQIKNQLKRSL